MDARKGNGWRDVVRDQMAVRSEEIDQRSNGAASGFRLNRVHFSAAVQPYLVAAARQRGISIGGYVRRATMARVAADLGIDPIALFQADSAIRSLGTHDSSKTLDRDLDGAKYGRWEVGCDDPGAHGE